MARQSKATASYREEAARLARQARRSTRPATALADVVRVLMTNASPLELAAVRRVVAGTAAAAEPEPLAGGARPRAAELWRQAQQRVLDEEALSSTAVSQLLGSDARNTRQYAMELRQRGELLGVPVRNRHLYPAFQFDTRRRAVYEVVKQVCRVLSADRDPWGALSWWVSPNARLPDHRAPKELLTDPTQHGVLLELARAVTGDSG
ncbi:MAG: hypothetical protein HY906_04975 [Deltaproteobacteria bacterium]|nr:hypothetical protein [Deltaproteobacteria bacterium]